MDRDVAVILGGVKVNVVFPASGGAFKLVANGSTTTGCRVSGFGRALGMG